MASRADGFQAAASGGVAQTAPSIKKIQTVASIDMIRTAPSVDVAQSALSVDVVQVAASVDVGQEAVPWGEAAVWLVSDDPELDEMFCRCSRRAVSGTGTDPFCRGSARDWALASWIAQTGDRDRCDAIADAHVRGIFAEDSLFIPSPVSEGASGASTPRREAEAGAYLYGGSLFALICNEDEYPKKLWPSLKRCAQICRDKWERSGICVRDSFSPEAFAAAGSVDLFSLCLTYGGFLLFSTLAEQQGEIALAFRSRGWASDLRQVIEEHFGGNFYGFRTYRHASGGEILHPYICLPLCVGIFDRREDTLNALFSPYLWSKNGIRSRTGEPGEAEGEPGVCESLWTLLAFRASFLAGRVDPPWDSLKRYLRSRLSLVSGLEFLEDGRANNQAFSPEEAALFCRLISEGLFRLKPLGRGKYSVTPNLPGQLTHLKFDGWHLAGCRICLEMERGKPCNVSKDGKVFAQGEIGTEMILDLNE